MSRLFSSNHRACHPSFFLSSSKSAIFFFRNLLRSPSCLSDNLGEECSRIYHLPPHITIPQIDGMPPCPFLLPITLGLEDIHVQEHVNPWATTQFKLPLISYTLSWGMVRRGSIFFFSGEYYHQSLLLVQLHNGGDIINSPWCMKKV